MGPVLREGVKNSEIFLTTVARVRHAMWRNHGVMVAVGYSSDCQFGVPSPSHVPTRKPAILPWFLSTNIVAVG